jgi:hypothetical protein
MSAGHKYASSAESTVVIEAPALSVSQQDMVRSQLDRILASPLLRNSKRFPDFLRYTVNRALEGNTADIKERTVGIEVFGRAPDYDTAADPVVRVTAAEVRKRLTQYYRELGHENELRIEFARGSYVPEIRFCAGETPHEVPVAAKPAVAQPFTRKQWLVIGSLAAPYVVVLLLFLLGTTQQSAQDRFFGPITDSRSPVLLCIPAQGSNAGAAGQTNNAASTGANGAENTGAASTQATALRPGAGMAERVSAGDSIALSTLTGILGSKGKEFHVRFTDGATLDDLKDGPVVLVGGFSNQWTMRLDGGLRFSLEHDGNLHYIADRLNPNSRNWAVSMPTTPGGTFADYALVSRVLDRTTGRVLVTVAGIRHFGTESAAECLADSPCLEAAEKLAPGDWKHANVQIVLRTTVIGNDAGEPQVLAAYLW